MSKIYCGDKEELPEDYYRRGSRRECLRKGVGVGLHLQRSNSQENKEEDIGLEIKMMEEEKLEERRSPQEETINKQSYQEFLDKNFDKARRTSRRVDLGDVFHRLAQLWVLEKKLNKQSIVSHLYED